MKARWLLILAVCAHVACAKKAAAPTAVRCFDAVSTSNSPTTQAIFSVRECQGGGVTWAAILRVLSARRGRVAPVVGATPGWTGDVSTLNGAIRFSIDDEADAARFCTDDAGFLAAMRAEYERVNADPAELRRAMGASSAVELECFDADGGAPRLPAALPPPVLPASATAHVLAGLARIRSALERERAWCFPDDDVDHRAGVIRILADGRATHSRKDGTLLAEGTWSWPRPGSVDERIEIILRKDILHLDAESPDRLGFHYADNGTLKREELIPGARCPGLR